MQGPWVQGAVLTATTPAAQHCLLALSGVLLFVGAELFHEPHDSGDLSGRTSVARPAQLLPPGLCLNAMLMGSPTGCVGQATSLLSGHLSLLPSGGLWSAAASRLGNCVLSLTQFPGF